MQQATSKLFERSIFIFRRDLRLYDNTALIHALKQSQTVIPCFIFDENQINPENNKFFSHNCVQFMIESLHDLNRQLSKHGSRLHFFYGDIENTISHMISAIKPQALFVNEDVTPYSIKRDKTISSICEKNNVKFFPYEDMMLHSKNQAMLDNGFFFQMFTPYYKKVSVFPIPEPQENSYDNYISAKEEFPGEFPVKKLDDFYQYNPHIAVNGGRSEGLRHLDNVHNMKNYPEIRNIPSLSTTKLSAYNKFGCLSIREVYYKVKDETGEESALAKQLYWRDFYYGVMFHYPHVLLRPMKEAYENLQWEDNKEHLERWCKGMTGCPIVDAGMRQLNKTGFLTNRMRLIVANYLVKDLLINWQLGEQYFGSQLVDYDVSQNNGSWQWVAGAGCDTQPYFRIFNPNLQSVKFDSDCEYIKKFVPELKGVPKDHIHRWEDHWQEYKDKVNYPAPIVKHFEQKDKVVKMYEDAVGKPTPVLGIHHDNKQYGKGKKRYAEMKENKDHHHHHKKKDHHNHHKSTGEEKEKHVNSYGSNQNQQQVNMH